MEEAGRAIFPPLLLKLSKGEARHEQKQNYLENRWYLWQQTN